LLRPWGFFPSASIRARDPVDASTFSLLTKSQGAAYTSSPSNPHGRSGMSLQDRVESLKAKHAALENAIEAEVRRPSPDANSILSLKRQKLRIKDELADMGAPITH
jgi:hypothetical protein